MADELVIELVLDTSKLEGVTTQIKAAGTEQEKQFQKANSAAKEYDATMQRISKSVDATGKAQGKSASEIAKMHANFKSLSQTISQGALEQVAQEAELVANEFKGVAKEFVDTTNKSKSMKTELRALKAELSLLEDQGQENSLQFQEMAVRAAQLEDQIGDTNARIRALASDTAVFDGLIGAVQGLAGGFAVVQGAAALFGDESEEVQQALLKVNSAMAILQGLQSIQATLQKQSAASLLLTTTYQKAYNLVVDQTTGKLRLMNAAFALTGIGALILLIGALIANFDELRSALGFTTDSTEALNDSLEQQDKFIKNLNESFSQQEKLLKALGASELELAEFKLKSARAIAFAELAKLQTLEESTNKQQEQVNRQIQTSTNLLNSLGILGGLASSAYDKLYGVSDNGERLKKTREQLDEQRKNLESAVNDIIVAEAEIDNVQTKAAEDRVKRLREIDKKRFEGFEAIKTIDKIDVDVDAIVASSSLSMEQKAAILRALGVSPEEIEKAFRKGYEMVLAGTGDMTPVKIPVEVKADFTAFRMAAEAAIEATSMVIDSFYQNQSEKRQQDLSQTLSTIAQKRQEELANEELTASQRKAIEDKYRRLEAAEKTKAWKAEQKAKGEQALINGLLAFTQSLAQQGYPAGLISGGIALGLAGLQAGLIFSKPVPAFEKGTKGNQVTPPGFKLVGEKGPELLYDGGGKKVITAPDTAKILSAYNIPALPDLSSAMALKDAAIGYAMPVIDYKMLGEEVGKSIAKHPKVVLNIDKNGMQIHHIKGNRRIQILNKDYNG